MDCERDGISVLVVDDDEISLAILANILIAWKCKVLTAKSVRNALETLREFEGFFDLVITEFHMPGMSGFEFQKHVKDEFQLPVIMMCANNRKHVISKSLEDDATLFIMKPFCADDFRNIWKYAIDARKEKLVIENKLRSGEEDATLSSTEPKSKRQYCKRKYQREEDQIGGRFRAIKKPKIVWTTYLHNLFLFAIKQLGMDKAVPKKILEVMNVPTLTRENVASHLQKYRIFLRKVAEKGMIEGLSHRALRSKFASGLPISVIQEIKTRSEKLHHVHAQQYLKSVSYQTGNALKPNFNQVPISLVNQQVSNNNNNTYVSNTTQLGRSQYPYLHQGLMLQNEYANPLKSSFGSNIGTNNNYINQNMLGRFANPPYNLSNCSYNDGAMFSAYGGRHGLMTSAKCLSGGLNLKYGDPLNQNYGSIGNHSYGYGLGNWNMGSLSSSYNILPQTNTYYPSINSSGIQLNGGSQMVETVKKGGLNSVGINAATANNNSFGFMNGTQNANMNVASLVLESFGLVQGKFGFDAVTNAGVGRGSELPETLITAENISGITELPQLKLDGNSVKNEHQFINATSFSEGEVNQLEDDLSELFLMLDDMNLLNEMEEIPNASEFWNSDFSSSGQVVQPLEQFNRAGDVIVLPAKSTSNLPIESPTSSEQNSNQLGGDDGFANREPYDRIMGDNVSSASTSATDEDWDMELIEALFGTVEN